MDTSPSNRELERISRRRRLRRQRTLAGSTLALIILAIVAALATSGGGSAHPARTETGTGGSPAPVHHAPSSFGVGLRVLQLTDEARSITLPDGTSEPRALTTYVRYPATGPAAGLDVPYATPDKLDGPYPLIVFGHGFDVEPSLYRRLLESWAHAGYVVAAPVFPRESPRATGGPDEEDLVNQPADMRFVIDRLLAESAGQGPLAGLIDPSKIAVSGHSDGGDTALGLAYDPPMRDRRIGAAAILSGAEIPALGPFAFPLAGPPLLATQGTADTVNLPSATEEFFTAAHTPKYLLRLLGAQHLPPYSQEGPQLRAVEQTTLAFFDDYLKGRPQALEKLSRTEGVPGVASLLSEP